MPRCAYGCQGTRRAEADSVAYLTCARLGIQARHAFASPPAWAGTDPRARPAAAIVAAGERITTAARRISHHLDHHLPGRISPGRTEEAITNTTVPASTAEPDPEIQAILADAAALGWPAR